MIFHHPQKKIRIPEILIDNVPIQCVESFNLLGIYLDEHMSWKHHIFTAWAGAGPQPTIHNIIIKTPESVF